MAVEQTATQETYDHYNRKGVKETILRLATDGEASKWLVGDSTGWYQFSQGKKVGHAANSRNYEKLTNLKRTLYGTLSYFDQNIFSVDFKSFDDEKDEAKKISREHVRAFTFGIDIDTIDNVNYHGTNIREPIVKEAVEAMANYFAKKIRAYAPNSVYAAFSGGGIYLFVHHGVFEKYFEQISGSEDYSEKVSVFTGALNNYIDELSEQFYTEYPQYKEYVKADSINNAKRVFKILYSVHRKHPFAVVPLEIENIEINFEDATLPLPEWVVEMGEFWYRDYDTDGKFLEFLTSYINDTQEIKIKRMQRATTATGGVQLSKHHFDISSYPPCVKNVLAMEHCGVGASRALGFLAAFLGQVGTTREEALQIWSEVSYRWGLSGTHIFDSWYQRLNCPCCLTLGKPGPGYPHIDIASIHACQPNMTCFKVSRSSPVHYVDREQYKEKLRRELFA